MNDTTYLASVLDAHRAEDLRREVALLAQHAEHDAEAPSAPAARRASAAASTHHHSWWPHRSGRRSTSVATR
ncbi:hypothetical protein ACFVSU_13970 [Microbacterium sp. NPDC058062]|uniref:hypothetical protein n=1 Tax=Microbacterium sp. NPDC058062 TaxID=3346320 RepID=UPI0036DAB2C0